MTDRTAARRVRVRGSSPPSHRILISKTLSKLSALMASRSITLALLAVVSLAVTAAAHLPAATSRVLAHTPRARVVAAGEAPQRVEVCRGRHCARRGSAKTLALLQELAPDGVTVSEADTEDEEHGCFDECTMGPNVRVDGKRIVNGIKGAAACAELLGVDPPAA